MDEWEEQFFNALHNLDVDFEHEVTVGHAFRGNEHPLVATLDATQLSLEEAVDFRPFNYQPLQNKPVRITRAQRRDLLTMPPVTRQQSKRKQDDKQDDDKTNKSIEPR